MKIKKITLGILTASIASFCLAKSESTTSKKSEHAFEADYVQSNPDWGLDRIDSIMNSQFRYPDNGGAGVDIYIVDSGIYSSHPEFEGRVVGSFDTTNYINYDNIVFEPESTCNSHGTHVAGIAASSTYGVAKEAHLYNVRVLDGCNGSPESVLEGLKRILEHYKRPGNTRPAVVNMSISSTASSYVVADIAALISDMVAEGMVVVASAGNKGNQNCSSFPANHPSVITVAASDSQDRRLPSSNHGSCVDLFAPGHNILSTASGNSQMVLSGTSQAAPFVSGAAALYLAQNPNATPAQVKAALINNAEQNVIYSSLEGTGHFLDISFLGGSLNPEPVTPNTPSVYHEYAGCSGSTPLYALSWSVTGPYTSFEVQYVQGYNSNWKHLYSGTNTSTMYYGLNNSQNKIRVRAVNNGLYGAFKTVTLPIKNCAGSPPPPIE